MLGPPPPKRPSLLRNVVIVVVSALATVVLVAVVLAALVIGFVLSIGAAMGEPIPVGRAPAEGLFEEPFHGLQTPRGMAVGADGTIYVTDDDGATGRVLELEFASNDQIEVPITGLGQPTAVAVDEDGTIYVADNAEGADGWSGRVLMLREDADAPEELAFGPLGYVTDLVVDEHGTVYITTHDNRAGSGRVLSLRLNHGTPTELPIEGLNSPQALAIVDDASSVVFVADGFGNTIHTYSSGRDFAQQIEQCVPMGLSAATDDHVYVSCREGKVVYVDVYSGEAPQVVLDGLGEALSVIGGGTSSRTLYVTATDGTTGKVLQLIS